MADSSSTLFNNLPLVTACAVIGALFIGGTLYIYCFKRKYTYTDSDDKEKSGGLNPSDPGASISRSAAATTSSQLEHFQRGPLAATLPRGIEEPLAPNCVPSVHPSSSRPTHRDSVVIEQVPESPSSPSDRSFYQDTESQRTDQSRFSVVDQRDSGGSWASASVHSPTDDASIRAQPDADIHALQVVNGARTESTRDPSSPPPAFSPPLTPSTFDYDDDGLSLKTSSTLPPSYRTRHSAPDLSHPLPPLPGPQVPGSPRTPPPSAYFQRGHRLSQHTESNATRPSDRPIAVSEGEEGVEAQRLWGNDRRTRLRQKRSRDGGIRLDGGPLGMSPPPPPDDGTSMDLGSTRPPSYADAS